CASYTERSVSGKGVHIIVRGHSRTNKHDPLGLEVFCNTQFFICTGSHWAGSPAEVQAIEPDTLAHLHALIDASKEREHQARADAKAAAAPSTSPRPSKPAVQAGEGGDDFKRINEAALADL